MFIFCSIVIFQKTMSRFLQSRLQFYSQFVPRSQFHLKLCRVFPNQLDGAWISHVVRVRAGVNLCALALFTVQRVGTEGKTLAAIKYQLQYGRTRDPRLLRNVGTCLRLNKERSRIAHCLFCSVFIKHAILEFSSDYLLLSI